MVASAEQRARYRNFFEDFFADAELRNEEQEEVKEILEAVMIAGDVNEIQQAPNNREFEIDVEEGWKSEWRCDKHAISWPLSAKHRTARWSPTSRFFSSCLSTATL